MFGRVLEGIKVNEPRMRAIGLQHQSLQARRLHHRRHARRRRRAHVEPAHRVRESRAGRLDQKSAEALLIILLGGIGSLAGAVVGAFAFYGLGEAAQLITERKLLVEGIVILVVVVLLRDGLVGIRLPRLRRKARDADAPTGGARSMAEAPAGILATQGLSKSFGGLQRGARRHARPERA